MKSSAVTAEMHLPPWWTVLSAVWFSYHAFSIPFRIAFMPFHQLGGDHTWFMLCDYMIDAWFVVDMVLRFDRCKRQQAQARRYVRLGDDLVIVAASRQRGSEYVRSWGAIADALATLPLELAAHAAGVRMVALFRLNRLVRIVRNGEYRAVLRSLLQKSAGAWLSHVAVMRMWHLFAVMGVASYFMACALYFVSLQEALRGHVDVWIVQDGLVQVLPDASGNATAPPHALRGDGVLVIQDSAGASFLRALYWAIVTMVTVGFGDLVPATFAETLVGSLAAFVGFCITGACLGNLVVLFTSLDKAYAVLQQRLELLGRYLRARHLPASLARRVVEYFEYAWASAHGMDEARFQASLSPALQARVTAELAHHLLRRVPGMDACSPALLRAISARLQHVLVAPGTAVMDHGDRLLGVYIVRRGTLDVTLAGLQRAAGTFTDGAVLGAVALLRPAIADVTVVARTYSELYFLPCADVARVLATFPVDDDVERLHRAAAAARKAGMGVPLDALRRPSSTVLMPLAGPRLHWTHPDSAFRRAWALLRFVALAYNAFSVPADLAFYYRDTANVEPLEAAKLAVSYAVDVFFVVDIVLNARWFAFWRDGVAEFRPRPILQRYLRGSCVADVLAALPLDVLALPLGHQALPLLRIGKVARLFHLYQYFRDAEAVVMALRAGALSNTARRLSRLLFMALLATHWAACCWILVADLSLRWGAATSWAQADEAEPAYEVDHDSNFVVWVRSVYWVLIGTSTLGYGDIVPINLYETAYCVVLVFFGALMYPALVGGVASLLQNLNPVRDAYWRRVQTVQEFMHLRGLPRSLRDAVQQLAEFCWQHQGVVDEREILASLPPPLLAEVQACMNGSALAALPFLQGASPALMRDLLLRLEPELYAPHVPDAAPAGPVLEDSAVAPSDASQHGALIAARPDPSMLAHQGTLGDRLLLLQHGRVQVLAALPDRAYGTVTLALAHSGDAVGVEALLRGARRSVSVRPLTYCTCYSLSRQALEDALVEHIQERATVLRSLAEHAQRERRGWGSILRNLHTHRKARAIADDFRPQLEDSRRAVPETSPRHPSSLWRTWWTAAVSLATLYNFVVWPLRVAFTSPLPPAVMLLDYALDALLVADIALNARYFAVLQEGHAITAPAQLWPLYRAGAFWRHLVAAFPLELIALFVLPAAGAATAELVWTLLRATRLLRGRDLKAAASRLSLALRHSRRMRVNHSTVRLCALLVMVLLLGHWGACGWCLLAKLQALGRHCPPELDTVGYASEPWAGGYANNSFGMTPRAYCAWHGTWLQIQVMDDLLPADAGTQAWRYLRAMNWAIPTLVVVVNGDTVPATTVETAVVVLFVLLGVTVNAIIVDRIAQHVGSFSSPSATFRQQADRVEAYMATHAIPNWLRDRARAYLAYVWRTRRGLEEAEVLRFLPTTLRAACGAALRRRVLASCPLFATCDHALLQELGVRLRPQTLGPDDTVRGPQEVAHSMYFVVAGELQRVEPGVEDEVRSLHPGDYFGEEGLLEGSASRATVVATEFSEVYELTRADLDAAMAKFPEAPALGEARLPLLDRMRLAAAGSGAGDEAAAKPEPENGAAAHTRAAVLPNAAPAASAGAVALRKYMTDLHISLPTAQVRHVHLAFLPNSRFRQVWDVLCVALTLYNAVAVPYQFAFVLPPMQRGLWVWLGVDALVSLLFLVDVALRACCFAYVHRDRVHARAGEIWARYWRGWFAVDLLSSLPWPLLVVHTGNLELMYALALPALLRLGRLRYYTRTVARYYRFWRRSSAQVDVVRVLSVAAGFLLIMHWYACVWMVLHRFVEYRSSKTWAIRDGLATFDPVAGHHNICDAGMHMCYLRAVYFVIILMSSIGYGDIRPYTPSEVVFHIVVAITGASLLAALAGSFQALFWFHDSHGNNALRMHVTAMLRSMRAQRLSEPLQRSILSFQHAMWQHDRGANERDTVSRLSLPLQRELAFHAKRTVLERSVLRDCTAHALRQLALAMRYQVCHALDVVYEPGYPAAHLYIVRSGRLQANDAEQPVAAAADVPAGRRHPPHEPRTFGPGDHFGEDCISGRLAAQALPPDVASPVEHRAPRVDRAAHASRGGSGKEDDDDTPRRSSSLPTLSTDGRARAGSDAGVVRMLSRLQVRGERQSVFMPHARLVSPSSMRRHEGPSLAAALDHGDEESQLHSPQEQFVATRVQTVQALEFSELYTLSERDLCDVVLAMPRSQRARLVTALQRNEMRLVGLFAPAALHKRRFAPAAEEGTTPRSGEARAAYGVVAASPAARPAADPDTGGGGIELTILSPPHATASTADAAAKEDGAGGDEAAPR